MQLLSARAATGANPLNQVAKFLGIEYVRVTSVEAFQQCPRRWVANTKGIGGRKSQYATIGTAVHLAIEYYLAQKLELPLSTEWHTYLQQQMVPDNEITNLEIYLQALEPIRPNVKLLEHEFLLELIPDALPICGHMDAVFVDGDTLIIRDHKTNRSFEGTDIWAARYQPRLYSWAARKLWPGFRSYQFEIGYVNLGTVVRWESNPNDEPELQAYYQTIWDELVQNVDTDNWREVFSQGCGFCGLREGCNTYRQTVGAFKESFQHLLEEASIPERYYFIQQVRKVAERVEAELKQELLLLLRAGPVKAGDVQLTAVTGSRRQLHFSDVWYPLLRAADTDEALNAELAEVADSLFTVKVGEVDKLIKKVPQIRHSVEEATVKVPFSEPTIKVTPLAITTAQVTGNLLESLE